jgi:Helix-turn-helix family
MTTPFGPQLIGETEKTLNALLLLYLEGTGLTEPQWVTLRLAGMLDGVDTDGLAAAVADRAHFTDAEQLVGGLTARGLLDNGRLTSAGRALVADVQASTAAATAPIWDGLPTDDIAATVRVINEVLDRAHAALAQ